MTPGKIDAQRLATLAGRGAADDGLCLTGGSIPVAERERPRATYPPKPPVPFADYAIAKEACGRSSALILDLCTRLEFYEPRARVILQAEAHRRYLRSLG